MDVDAQLSFWCPITEQRPNPVRIRRPGQHQGTTPVGPGREQAACRATLLVPQRAVVSPSGAAANSTKEATGQPAVGSPVVVDTQGGLRL
jgi:hypothetical protein